MLLAVAPRDELMTEISLTSRDNAGVDGNSPQQFQYQSDPQVRRLLPESKPALYPGNFSQFLLGPLEQHRRSVDLLLIQHVITFSRTL
jgi:hypothetical protein